MQNSIHNIKKKRKKKMMVTLPDTFVLRGQDVAALKRSIHATPATFIFSDRANTCFGFVCPLAY